MGAIPAANDALKDLPDMKSFGLGIVILGVICLVIGLLGCATAKCKKCIFALLFIILTGLLGLICLIIGFVMIGAGGDLVKAAVDKICTTANDELKTLTGSVVDGP